MKSTRMIAMMAAVLTWTTARAATFSVINTNDTGAGSLRQAMLDANASNGVDTIAFDITEPASGVRTITPVTTLTSITDPVVIDGYTQPGTTNNTLAVGDNAVLLIELDGTLTGSGSGLNISSGNTTVRGLAINRFGNGIVLATAGGNVIEGNFIGTDASGTGVFAKRGNGIIISVTSNNRIGGTSPASRNIISGCDSGVIMNGFGLGTASNNSMLGNYIGTDKTGTVALGNTLDGIAIGDGAPGNIVGGTTPGAGNLISGNSQYGIHFEFNLNAHFSPDNNLVQGNLIGTDVTGNLPLGNGLDGILCGKFSNFQTIGGTAAGAGNRIAFNGGRGINTGLSTGDSILGNAIFSNGSLGIDLAANGVTPNDPCDADTGDNNLQNFPVLTSASTVGGSVTIQGLLDSASNTTFTLEFFANPCCDPSGFGEGETFLGRTNVTTGANCTNNFTVTFTGVVGVGQAITATATDTNSNNTSEFSACAIVEGIGAVACSIEPALATNTVGTTHSVTNTVTIDGLPICQVPVTFNVISGPNTNQFGADTTDENGETVFTYLSNGTAGTDIIHATGTVNSVIFTCTAAKVWIGAPTNNQPPVAVCQNVTTNANANCQAILVAADFDGGSFDNDGSITGRSIIPTGLFDKGVTQVILTVTDNNGASDSCTATVTVVDNTLPVLTCSNILASAVAGQSNAVVNFTVHVTENCGTPSLDCTPASGSTFDLGTTTVTCIAVDSSANTNTCNFDVIVSEAPPVPHDLALIKLHAVKNVNLKGAAPSLTKFVKVTLQNRSPHSETITNFNGLVTLVAESLGTNCPNATVVLHAGPPNNPKTLKPKQKLAVTFDVTYNCANDPLKGAGHEDFRYLATVHHDAIDGQADTHTADDNCPRAALSGGVDNVAGLNIKDTGCAGGVDVKTDVFLKP